MTTTAHRTAAVTVEGTPPVTKESLNTCIRKLAEFAADNNFPVPFVAEWVEHDGVVYFVHSHEGRVFTAGAPKAN